MNYFYKNLAYSVEAFMISNITMRKLKFICAGGVHPGTVQLRPRRQILPHRRRGVTHQVDGGGRRRGVSICEKEARGAIQYTFFFVP